MFAYLPLRIAALTIVMGCFLSACSSLDSDKVDYKTASQGRPLEVPPDLTQLAKETPYQIRGGTATASESQSATSTPQATLGTAGLSLGDVRVERSGNQRWLVVKRPPEALWSSMRDFWQDNGFLLTLDDQKLGIMETDWAENRAKLPQDFIRNSLGKIFDQLYSTGERDRFRTRLERQANGDTEIYVSHRGMVEKLTAGTGSNTVWEPRAADPELETEFLRRLMVRLGTTKEQSSALVAAAQADQPKSVVKIVGDQAQLELPVGFDVAWRRVGLALDRTGFTVEDRDRSQGIYFVRYVPPKAESKDSGFLSKLFSSSSNDSAIVKYRVSVVGSGDQTVVRVLNDVGKSANTVDAQNILKILSQDLR